MSETPTEILDMRTMKPVDKWTEKLKLLGFHRTKDEEPRLGSGMDGEQSLGEWRLNGHDNIVFTYRSEWCGGGGNTFFKFKNEDNGVIWEGAGLDELRMVNGIAGYPYTGAGWLDMSDYQPWPIEIELKRLGFKPMFTNAWRVTNAVKDGYRRVPNFSWGMPPDITAKVDRQHPDEVLIFNDVNKRSDMYKEFRLNLSQIKRIKEIKTDPGRRAAAWATC